MFARLHLLLFVALAALVGVACSSTTTVERADRPATESPEPVEAASDSSGSSADTTDQASADPTPTVVPPRELEEASGYGLGGFDQLAGLVRDCQGGSDQACDILLPLSEANGPDEDVALNCGGRRDGEALFCTDGFQGEPSGETIYFDLASSALDTVDDDCKSGDMTACDFLFYRSPPETEYEETGNTCGGRTQVALPDCRTFFAAEE